MTTVQKKLSEPVKNDNLKNLKSLTGKPIASAAAATTTAASVDPKISEAAKQLNSGDNANAGLNSPEAATSAASVAKNLLNAPVLPILIPKEASESKNLAEKLSDKPVIKTNFIKKPAVIFIEGFSALGISNGDGIKDMADNFPGSKRFSWNEQEKIIEEIKKHAVDQPVVLVGHSFGGDSAVEIANSLNNLKNGFRPIDLLVSIDSVGMNHSIIPMNVKRNLNFFGEGVVPFLHGEPNIARNTDYTEVINELRSELHSKMEDSEEVQFKIFNDINEVLSENDLPDLFEEMQKNDLLKALIDTRQIHVKL